MGCLQGIGHESLSALDPASSLIPPQEARLRPSIPSSPLQTATAQELSLLGWLIDLGAYRELNPD